MAFSVVAGIFTSPFRLIFDAALDLMRNGAEFARQVAAKGLHVLLIARREAALKEVADSILAAHAVTVRTLALDLSDAALPQKIDAATAGLEVGLLICNAAHSSIGEFLQADLEQSLRTLDVNCRAPIILAHALGRKMAARRRGGIIFMSSMAAGQGSPLITTYAATKAFNLVFAEGLWEELRGHGVDVIACRAGATRTPNYVRSQPRGGEMLVGEPGPVARDALESLGRRMSVTPGLLNAASSFMLGKLLPRRLAVSMMAKATRSMYGAKE
jgi:hypothetical protein